MLIGGKKCKQDSAMNNRHGKKKNNKNFKYGKIISMHQMLKYHSCCETFFTNEIFFYLPINNNYLLPPPPTELKFHPTIPRTTKIIPLGTKGLKRVHVPWKNFTPHPCDTTPALTNNVGFLSPRLSHIGIP